MTTPVGVVSSSISSQVLGSKYLDSSIGYASTPDFAALAASGNFTLTARCVVPHTTGANRMLVAQWPSSPTADQAILWFITTAGIMQMTMRQAGNFQSTGNILTAAEVNALGSSPVYIGVRCTASTARFAAITSTDGINWTEIGTPQTGANTWSSIINSAAPLHIGSRSVAGTEPFVKPIYWAEMWRGSIYPGAGTRVFRYESSDWLAGTSWTDPRGQTWTLSAAGAVHV